MVVVFDKDGNESLVPPELLESTLAAGYTLELVEKPKRGRPVKPEESTSET